jgi:hypothetical protein
MVSVFSSSAIGREFELRSGHLIHLGLSYTEIETIRCDYQENIQNTMCLCLQLWRRKRLDATLADIKNALEKEENYSHISPLSTHY